MKKKYEFTGETKCVCNPNTSYAQIEVHRIRAIRSFGIIKEGDLGGWIENENNLSHEGNCWVDDEAVVIENARVQDNARIHDHAIVCGNATISENACILDRAEINGCAYICEHAAVLENARVEGNAQISGFATIGGKALVRKNAIVRDHAKVTGQHTTVSGNSLIEGRVKLHNGFYAKNSHVTGNFFIYEKVFFGHNALICCPEDYFIVTDPIEKNDIWTFYRTIEGFIFISRTGREPENAVDFKLSFPPESEIHSLVKIIYHTMTCKESRENTNELD